MKRFLPGTALLIWTGAFLLRSSISCKTWFLVKTLNVRFAIKPCVWSCQDMIQSDLKKQKNKPKARVFDLALWGAHHISISLLADVDGGVSDSGQPLYSGPVLQALGKGEGGALYSLLTPAPKPKPQAAPWLMPPLTLLTSEANPRPAGRSLKPPTVTTQPPPVAATLLPLTYHPKHYHKHLPGCQAAHTAELTVRLWTARPCKDSSVWGKKVELVERGKRSGLRWHFNRDIKPTVVFYVLWLVVMLWHLPVEQTPARCNNYCAVFEADEKCVRQCVNRFWNMPQVCVLAWQIVPFHIASASAEIEESIEVWLSWEDHTHLVLR